MTERRFSDRVGATTSRAMLQVGEMDDALRNSLWNYFYSRIDAAQQWREFAKEAFVLFLKRPLDEIPSYDYKIVPVFKKWFFAAEWFEVYNFIEYLVPRMRKFSFQDRDPAATVNAILEREMAGYRWIANSLTPITSLDEVASVADSSSPRIGYEGVATHMAAASALLGKRPEPDLRNSIKESISAIEATVKLVTGQNSGGGIDKALAIIEKREELHPVLKVALSKLYAYTSDEDGVRHAILDQPTVTFGEAKFMLVACSAFVNLVLDAVAARS